MNDGLIIGIDAGTSVIKSAAFTVDGKLVATAQVANSYSTHSDGGVEQDMARTWLDTASTLQMLGEQIPQLPQRLIAIAVTGQGDGTWLIDKHGKPTAPAWLWLDARATDIVKAFADTEGCAAHYNRTGTGVNVCQMSVQLAWLQRHRPELLAGSTHAFHCKDWIYFNLTGERVTDPSEANFTFGNYQTRQYNLDILDQLEAAAAKRLITPVVDGTTDCGLLTKAAAKLTGLLEGTPICLGYVDVLCTGLGGGLFDPTGQSGCTIVGSTGMHMRLQPDTSAVTLNDERSGYTMVFPVPGMATQIQSNMASTLNIDWLLDLSREILKEQDVLRSRTDILKSWDHRLLETSAAKVLYHPYISKSGERGPFMEPEARAMLTGFDVTTNHHDILRSVFEGLAFAAYDCYSAMGPIPREVRLTGGAAKSALLRSILSSVLGAEVRSVTRDEAGAAGAAMIAAVQQKIFSNMSTCADVWVNPHLSQARLPDPSLVETYKHAYLAYKECRDVMRPIWQKAGRQQ
jgi:erythritol kinase (D-erythritol 1-phosphate-forming)